MEVLKHPKIDVNKCTVYGSSPLYYASEQGTNDIVKLLLQCPQTDVNLVRSGGESPLWRAASKGDDDLLFRLSLVLLFQLFFLDQKRSQPCCEAVLGTAPRG